MPPLPYPVITGDHSGMVGIFEANDIKHKRRESIPPPQPQIFDN